jgi:hypothetical protein
MKKIISIMVIAIFIAGTIYAQERANPRDRQRADNSVSVEGNLKLEKGFVAVESGDSVYLIPLLNRYIGFINGLREGARVSVEGNTFRNVIMPRKVVIDNKTYEFLAGGPGIQRNNFVPGGQKNFAPRNMGPGRNMMPRNMGPNMPGHFDRKNAPNPNQRVRPGVSESS